MTNKPTKQLLQELGFSISRLAETTGYKPRSLYNILNGNSAPLTGKKKSELVRWGEAVRAVKAEIVADYGRECEEAKQRLLHRMDASDELLYRHISEGDE